MMGFGAEFLALCGSQLNGGHTAIISPVRHFIPCTSTLTCDGGLETPAAGAGYPLKEK
jgi:hypothetical protein